MWLRKGGGGVEQEGCNKKSLSTPHAPGDLAHVPSFPKF